MADHLNALAIAVIIEYGTAVIGIVMRRYLAVSACRSYLCACVPWLCK